MLRVQALLSNRTRPAVAVTAELFAVAGKDVLAIQVPRARSPVGTADGRYLRRTLGGDGKPACVPFHFHECTPGRRISVRSTTRRWTCPAGAWTLWMRWSSPATVAPSARAVAATRRRPQRAGIVERTARGVDAVVSEQIRCGRSTPRYETDGHTGVTLALSRAEPDLGLVRLLVEEERRNDILPLQQLLLFDRLWRSGEVDVAEAAKLTQCGERDAVDALHSLVRRGLCGKDGDLLAAFRGARGIARDHIRRPPCAKDCLSTEDPNCEGAPTPLHPELMGQQMRHTAPVRFVNSHLVASSGIHEV